MTTGIIRLSESLGLDDGNEVKDQRCERLLLRTLEFRHHIGLF